MNDLAIAMLGPVVALLIWTLIMWVWMYATRIPAILSLPTERQAEMMTPSKLEEHLPPRVQWKAHNYNHLHEQPTLFYAVCLVLAVVGIGEGAALWLAWGYVALRVVHSIFQATINTTPRFMIFVAATLCLTALVVIAALAVF